MGLTEILLPDALINQPLVNSKFLVEGKECRPPPSWRAGMKSFAHEFSSRILTSSRALQRAMVISRNRFCLGCYYQHN